MIAADMAFHDFIYTLSGNPLVAPSMETHWTNTQRVMGEVLMRDDKPRDIWNEHEALLDAVAGVIAGALVLRVLEDVCATIKRLAGLGYASLPVTMNTSYREICQRARNVRQVVALADFA
eukprot:gene35960-40668_t